MQRLSRHLYDIERLSRTEYAEKALNDKELYETIVAHRSKFSPIKGVDFTKQNPSDIKFVPPDNLLSAWEADYKDMQENMIHGESSPFAELIEKLKTLQEKINGTKWDA